MNHIVLALMVAREQLGKPYLWAGDDPMAGFDCSGLMIEILKSCGMLPRSGDWTADQLMKVHGWPVSDSLGPGCLVFWGTAERATHVEMIYTRIGTDIFTIGASGGGSKTDDLQAAVDHNAYVKIRPITGHPGYISIRDPFAEVREE